MSRIDEARSAWANAVERMEDLDIQLQGLPDNTEPEVTAQIEQRFLEARQEAERKRQDFHRQELIQEARTLGVEDRNEDNEHAEATNRGEMEPRSAGGTTTLLRDGRIEVTKEPLTYDKGRDTSFFRDLYYSKQGDVNALNRLQRHQREMMVERRDLSSTDGAGGDFVPPLWLMQDWTEVIRMGRPFANAVNNQPLPDGTDSISWPKVLTGSAVAAQADLGAVQETDPTTGSINVPVKTLAGQVDVAQQLLDRSVPGIDQVLFQDLRADYNLRIDLQALTGSGSGANAKGVTQDSNRIQVTYTDASPTVAEFYSKIQDAAQQILTNRGLPPDVIVLHPRRWAWIAAASDTTGRPLIVPAGASQNAPGTANGVTDLGRPGFTIGGLSVVVDANLPTNLGAGTNEDLAIVMRSADVLLWERPNPVTRVFDQVLSGNLAVRLQLFNYFAFSTERYSKAIATITGTGLLAPTF